MPFVPNTVKHQSQFKANKTSFVNRRGSQATIGVENCPPYCLIKECYPDGCGSLQRFRVMLPVVEGRREGAARPADPSPPRAFSHNAAVRDAVTAPWEASGRICGKRLKMMIPTLLSALKRHGRLMLSRNERALVLSVSAATIDRMLVDVKVAAAGSRRRRVGFYSAIRREVLIRCRANGGSPPPKPKSL